MAESSDHSRALELLEEALAACRLDGTPLPRWLCGRLAVLYRSKGRFDDEVALLEEYRDSQASDEERIRYDARLSKARTLAARKRRGDNGALDSIRQVISRPRQRAQSAFDGEARVGTGPFSLKAREELLAALTAPLPDESHLTAALRRIEEEARAADAPIEAVVSLFKEIKSRVVHGGTDAPLQAAYGHALTLMLAAYFESGA